MEKRIIRVLKVEQLLISVHAIQYYSLLVIRKSMGKKYPKEKEMMKIEIK